MRQILRALVSLDCFSVHDNDVSNRVWIGIGMQKLTTENLPPSIIANLGGGHGELCWIFSVKDGTLEGRACRHIYGVPPESASLSLHVACDEYHSSDHGSCAARCRTNDVLACSLHTGRILLIQLSDIGNVGAVISEV